MRLRITMLAFALAAIASACQTPQQAMKASSPAATPPLAVEASTPAATPPPASEVATPAATPPPAVEASTPAATPPPSAELEKTLCGPTSDPTRSDTDGRRQQELQDALRSRLQAATIAAAPEIIAHAASCLVASPVAGSSGKLLMVDLRPGDYVGKDRFAVWFFDGAWRVDHLPVDEYRTLPYPKYYKETPDGAEMISVGRNGGSGHAGNYSLIRFGIGMKVLWQTRLYDHLYDQRINDHVLMATYRDPAVYDEPHVYEGNCCLPMNSQTIWERQGDIFVEKAVRNHPSVLRATSAFVGAWNAGKLELAAVYAENASVVAAMKGDAGQPPQITLGPEPANLRAIEETEAAYWEALPAEYRGPKPTVGEFVWPATPRPLLLKRMDGEWKVVGWQQ